MFGKNYHYETSIILQRASILAILMVAVIGLIIIRLLYLQFVMHDSFLKFSEKNRTENRFVLPQRGLIFDRNGVLLASNTNKPSLMMKVGRNEEENKETLNKLSQHIPIDDSVLVDRKAGSIILLKYLNSDELMLFQLHKNQFPTLFTEENLERVYHYKDITAHIVGYTGNSDNAEYDRDFYKAVPIIGKSGVELFYEKELRGNLGENQLEMNVRGKEISKQNLQQAENGSNITTTIDIKLQTLAHELLQGHIGTIVAVETKTGDILAAVSSPSFDPNLFNFSSEKEELQELFEEPANPLFNRFTSGRYPPASTIKPFIGLVVLDSSIGKKFTIYDKGYYISETEDQKIFRNWQKKGAGKVNLNSAIVKSNNTYFYSVANKLGIDSIYAGLKGFGFGENVVLDIPNHSVGILPNPTWKMGQFGERWLPGDNINLSIGQGYILVNPLQLAYATNIIANKGKKIKLHINKNLVNTNIAFSQNTTDDFDFMIKSMTGVMHSKVGTAYKTQSETLGKKSKLQIAGKTGTAQVVNAIRDDYGYIKVKPIKNDNSLFIGFSPAKDPEITIVVILENAGSGSLVATPIGLKIIDNYLNNNIL